MDDEKPPRARSVRTTPFIAFLLATSLAITLAAGLAVASPGGTVELLSPQNGETVLTNTPTLQWSKVGRAQVYRVQVSTTPSFDLSIVDISTSDTSHTLANALQESTYYWRVNYTDKKGVDSAWSGTQSFIVDSTVILKRYPYLQSPSGDGLAIAWTTSGQGNGTAEYSSDGAPYTSVEASTTFFPNSTTEIGYDYTLYVANITDLTPGTDYSYKILIDGVDITPTGPHTFTTPAPSDAYFSFGALGDSGTGSSAQLAVRDQMLLSGVDFYVHSGDVAYSDGTYEEIESNVFDIYRDIFKGAPFNPSLGNHDYHTESGQPYLDSYVLPEQTLRASDTERYYSFDWGNAHFVSVDTNDPLSDIDSEASDDMFDWLRSDLQAANDRGMFWIIIYHHHPAFSSSTRHGSDSEVQSKLVPIYEQYGVDLVFNGHDHTYERTCPINLASAGEQCTTVSQGGVTYIVTGGGGRSLYNNGPAQWFTAYADSLHHFVRVDVEDCILRTQGIDTIGQVFDPHLIDRCATSVGAPEAVGGSVVTSEDVALAITLTASDTEQCELTFSVVYGPTNGALADMSDSPCSGSGPFSDEAVITYTPNPDFSGSDSFAFKANDGSFDSNIAVISITADPVNDPPISSDDAYTTSSESILAAPAPGVLGNDTDIDTDGLTAALDAGPSHGILILNDDGSFSYTPDLGFVGDDVFTYHAHDGQLTGNTATVTVTVVPEADVTLTGVDPATMVAGTTATVTISGSGFEFGAEVTFENGSGPAPTASITSVSDSQLEATVTTKSGGPPRDALWDVRVTNTNGSMGLLVDAFTVTR